MARYKSRRMARYRALRANHLTPIEAREFSKMQVKAYNASTGQTAPNPVIAKIVHERRAMFSALRVEAQAKNWSKTRTKREWTQRILDLYDSPHLKVRAKESKLASLFVKKDVYGRPLPTAQISPWEMYDSMQIIHDLEAWDTPRKHRARQPVVDISRVQRARWIHDLNIKILATIDPSEKRKYMGQRHRLTLLQRRAK